MIMAELLDGFVCWLKADPKAAKVAIVVSETASEAPCSKTVPSSAKWEETTRRPATEMPSSGCALRLDARA
jgi:hypothetical protein